MPYTSTSTIVGTLRDERARRRHGMAHGVRLHVGMALALGLLHAVSAKRTCSPPVPCHSSCDTERSHLHCKACKCRACTMCAVDSKRSRTAKSRPEERLQRLGRSRQWAPEAEATAQSANRSAAAVLLRMMGYVPGLQIPLEFGGPGEDYQVDPRRHVALARAEAAAAGPKVVPFYLQKAAAARGESAAASWLASPVAQLLARAKARPPYRAQLEPATLAPKAAIHPHLSDVALHPPLPLLRRTPEARKTKRVQSQLRKAKQQSSAPPHHSVAMLSSVRNLSMNWRPGAPVSSVRPKRTRSALFRGAPAAGAVDVTGKLNLRGMTPPKWCGGLSGKQDKCERGYLGRSDGKVNLCTYDADKSKCSAGKSWFSATGVTATPAESRGPKLPSTRAKRKGKPMPRSSRGRGKSKGRGKKRGVQRKATTRSRRAQRPPPETNMGMEVSWSGV